jgi:hypothetical protein
MVFRIDIPVDWLGVSLPGHRHSLHCCADSDQQSPHTNRPHERQK